jgi:hypothetical protein
MFDFGLVHNPSKETNLVSIGSFALTQPLKQIQFAVALNSWGNPVKLPHEFSSIELRVDDIMPIDP